ncbi:hypothetical protein [Aequorivita echinoideorum]|uniref:Uncharacterized protein n=1 Tax=Aequorivita echinoideorum TaxID=1549647 RepID=A0ABS5S9X3_9FLAO|nr:hypothetical protein [Aequorivita echinoideorum]MBT0609224.1 hypothetical protein [Aequorivita echinoideorum]
MNQSEFNEILNSKIRPFVSDVISKGKSSDNKFQYVSDKWKELENMLEEFDLPPDTFRDLNSRYRTKIENEILRK